MYAFNLKLEAPRLKDTQINISVMIMLDGLDRKYTCALG